MWWVGTSEQGLYEAERECLIRSGIDPRDIKVEDIKLDVE